MAARRKKNAQGKHTKKKRTGRGFRLKSLALAVLVAAACAALLIVANRGGPLKDLALLGERLTGLLPAGGRDAQPDRFWEAELFFGDEETDQLIAEKRRISRAAAPADRARLILIELLRGPAGRGTRTTPEATGLRSVRIGADGTALVDFSAALTADHPGGSSSEMITVYSIVNTLVFNIEEIRRVKLLVDGAPIDTIAGHIDCRQPFDANMKIMK